MFAKAWLMLISGGRAMAYAHKMRDKGSAQGTTPARQVRRVVRPPAGPQVPWGSTDATSPEAWRFRPRIAMGGSRPGPSDYTAVSPRGLCLALHLLANEEEGAMIRRTVSMLLTLAIATWLAACAPATLRETASQRAPAVAGQSVVDTGELEGAAYRIDIPANWNGELVVNAHGYETAGSPREVPLPFPSGMEPLLAQGFAIAASGYSAQGWAIPEAIADTERLRAHFAARHGAPERAWLVGWSMGGLVALASAERQPHAWSGVVAMCPVAESSETMIARGALGPLAAFDALFPGTLPQAPGGLADAALPPAADGDAIEAALAHNETRADALARRFDIPRSELAGSLWLYYLVLREVAQRANGFPVDSATGSEGVEGDEVALATRIRRYQAAPAALAYIRRTGALTGAAPVPVVLQPNAVDPIVPAIFSSGYLALAKAKGRGNQVRMLPPVGEGHCRFPPGSVVAALEAVRGR
ncbi:MAG: alpha/beta fold hydrolase [Burkholderiales bacterium]|nr:MAG: alpha/beta fold hydrolase [Burkholderiales bacterium]